MSDRPDVPHEAPDAATARDDEGRRCGFVALVGAPNAGKSTLLNALVGTKVSIVSHKVQTTRVPVRGIAMVDKSQIVFIDTPGIFAPRRRLDRAMVGAATGAAADADIAALLIDAVKGLDESIDRLIGVLKPLATTRILILNKVDKIKKDALLGLAAAVNEKVAFERTFMVSALTGSGVGDLKAWLAANLPAGPWHYPEDEITDATERSTAAEITREKIYEYLHEELPYQTTVETTAWEEKKDGSVRIEQIVFVERDSQRRIVLGEGGRAVKQISMTSRKELAKLFGRPVHLFIHVKVAEGWENNPEHYREMGLEFPKE
jgi:GTP-binding protein Era